MAPRIVASHPRFIDLTGKVFGRLSVLGRAPNRKGEQPRWGCRCTCGKETVVIGPSLRYGLTKSCGCIHSEATRKARLIHGNTADYKKAREYRIWINMKSRCFNSRVPSFRHYGARGITVCDRWNASFEAFLEDMGRCPDGMSIERINNDGNYEPLNCRWATRGEQSSNTAQTIRVTYQGRIWALRQLARHLKISPFRLHKYHVLRGIPIDRAVQLALMPPPKGGPASKIS